MECNDLRTLSTGCLKFCFQLGKAPTITTMGEKELSGHIEKRTTTADNFFFSKMAKTNMFEKFKMMLGVIDFTIRIKINGDY